MITKDYALHAMWGLILLIFGYTINEASESFKKINTKLESLEIMVASDYVKKQDLNRFESKLDHMNDMIISLIKETRVK